MERVLLTVELLELILSQVDDLRTVLTSASRVCHLWNQVIQSSPQLQTLLFFRPDTSLTKSGKSQTKTRTNPLLVRQFGGLLTSAPDGTYQPVSLPTHDGLLSSKASWRCMLMQQPPARKLGTWKIETGSSFEHGFEIITHMLDLGAEEGMFVGMLADLIKQIGKGSPWTLYWSVEGMERLKKERNSLLVRKARASQRDSLFKMWEESDIVVKFA